MYAPRCTASTNIDQREITVVLISRQFFVERKLGDLNFVLHVTSTHYSNFNTFSEFYDFHNDYDLIKYIAY